MIRFNSEIALDNGAIAKHFIVGMLSIINKEVSLVIDAFASKDLADKALKKYELFEQQEAKIKEFQELQPKEDEETELSIEILDKLNKLQSEVNAIADEIETITDYSDIVIDTKTIVFELTDDLSEEVLKTKIKESDIFKDKEVEFI